FKMSALLEYVYKFVLSLMTAFVLIWIVYAANTYSMPGEKVAAEAEMSLGQNNTLAHLAHDFTITLSQSPLFKPLSEYFLGVFMVFARVASGNVHYFLGEVTNAASVWYFPIVFLLKETLPFLFLLLLTLAYSLSRISASFLKTKNMTVIHFLALSLQNKITQYLSVFFILFYSYISITGNLNIGFRHLFPI